MTAAWSNGRRGQTLAVGIAVLGLALIWLCAVAPLRSWFDHRNTQLSQRQAFLQHIRDVAATLPRLRALTALGPDRQDPRIVATLAGSTDALAAAALEERLQKMAMTVGASLASVETMPTATTGHWHRVSLRIALNAPWPVLIDLVRVVEGSLFYVDDIHFHSTGLVAHPTVLPIQASLVLYGFRLGLPGSNS